MSEYRQCWKYILYMLIYFTLYISGFSVQRNLFNQPTEAYLKAKNVSVTVFNIHAWSDLAIVVCLVLDIYVQNQKILWEDEGRDFNGIPFIILDTKVLHCVTPTYYSTKKKKKQAAFHPSFEKLTNELQSFEMFRNGKLLW